VTSAESELGRRCSVGVGIPGAISPGTGLVRNANSVWLNGHGFDRDLGEALGRQVRVENDANCFALSEASDGAAAGLNVVFGVILGTGCGGGLVVGGRVLAGLHRIGGEWGHNPLPWADESDMPPRPCFCGNTGCNERYIAGPSLAEEYAGPGARDASPIPGLRANHQFPRPGRNRHRRRPLQHVPPLHRSAAPAPPPRHRRHGPHPHPAQRARRQLGRARRRLALASTVERRKHFFFKKKKQKTFDYLGCDLSRIERAKFAKVFCFFFSKKKCFLTTSTADISPSEHNAARPPRR
jgi:hypothetical protein